MLRTRPFLHLFHTQEKSMKAIRKTAARMYIDCMAETAAMGREAKAPPAKQKQPQRLIGGCLLYHLPLVCRQQHPPAPYYS